MVKLLLIFIAIWLLISVLKRYKRNMDDQYRSNNNAEDMVRCSYCGLHLPKNESFLKNSHYFCSEDHRDKAV